MGVYFLLRYSFQGCRRIFPFCQTASVLYCFLPIFPAWWSRVLFPVVPSLFFSSGCAPRRFSLLPSLLQGFLLFHLQRRLVGGF